MPSILAQQLSNSLTYAGINRNCHVQSNQGGPEQPHYPQLQLRNSDTALFISPHMNPAGGMKISFHSQSLQCSQYRGWPTENKKKANKPGADIKERKREIAGTYDLHCEKFSDAQSPTPEETLQALDF